MNLHLILRADKMEKYTSILRNPPEWFAEINALIFLNYKPANGDESLCLKKCDSKIIKDFFEAVNAFRIYHLAEETFSIQENILKQLQNKKEIQKAKIALAEYFVVQTKKLDASKDYLRAVMLAKKACTLYNGIDSNRLLELRAWLEKLQEKSVQNMQPIVIPYDTTHINKKIDALFLDLTIEEAIVQLGRITRIYHLDDIRNKVIQEQQQFIFKSLFASSLLNTKGQTIRELAPLDRKDPDSDKDLLFKHMVHYVSKQRSLESDTVLRYHL